MIASSVADGSNAVSVIVWRKKKNTIQKKIPHHLQLHEKAKNFLKVNSSIEIWQSFISKMLLSPQQGMMTSAIYLITSCDHLFIARSGLDHLHIIVLAVFMGSDHFIWYRRSHHRKIKTSDDFAVLFWHSVRITPAVILLGRLDSK